MRKCEFAMPPHVLAPLALLPLVVSATFTWIPPSAAGYVLSGMFLIMLGGWGAYAIRGFQFAQRQRRISDQTRRQREADLRRFADSLAPHD